MKVTVKPLIIYCIHISKRLTFRKCRLPEVGVVSLLRKPSTKGSCSLWIQGQGERARSGEVQSQPREKYL